MLTRQQSRLAKWARRALTAYIEKKDGVAAIEFAFVAPIMIAFYFGMSEIALGISADREVAHTASVTGDLATQVSVVNRKEMESIMTAALTVLGVPSEKRAGVTVELNSYQMRTDGSGTIDLIGYARMGSPISAGGPATFDPSTVQDMISETSGIVVARVNYKYEPKTVKFVQNMTLSETFVLKPRKSVAVAFDESGSTNFTCTANVDLSASCSAS